VRILTFLSTTFTNLFFVFAFTSLAGLGAAYVYFKNQLPQIPENLRYLNQQPPTEIYSYDGEILKILGDRSFVTLNLISPNFQKAIIAVEDADFYEHHGVDHRSLLRAFWVNLKNRGSLQGGSTITQQLAKNLFFSFKKSYERKLKEILMSFQIESTFSKEEILEAYANQIYFGRGVYGVNEASYIYFGKSAKELTLLQSAVLAGIPKSPNHFNPISNKKASLARGRYVLGRMVEEGFIKTTDKDQTLRSDLNLKEARGKSNPNSHFIDYVVNDLEKKYGKEFINFGGLKVFTTLDSGMQKAAHHVAEEHIRFLESHMTKKSVLGPLESAVISMENNSGAVRVMLGGMDYSKSQFNRAISNNRMPGSSFKPFVYMSAFEYLGYHPATVIVDEPITIKIPGTTPWQPHNFNDKFKGPVVLKNALAESLNVISAKLMYELSPKRVIHTARKFGIKSPLNNHYSLALGSSGISVMELASAYSVIANLGVYKEPFFIFRIEDYGGNILYDHFIEQSRRFPKQAIFPLLDMMKGVVEDGSGRVVRRVGFNHPAGAKTGTTNDFRDAWFTGYTRQYSTSVWVGFDDNSPMIGPNGKGLTGAHAAAPIWGMFMKRVLKNVEKQDFELPEEVRYEQVNSHNGFFSPDKSKDTIRVALHSGVALPVRPTRIAQENIKKINFNQTGSLRRPQNFSPPTDGNFDRVEKRSLLFAPIKQVKFNSAQLETQIWYVLNLDNASLGQSKQTPTSLLMNFLINTEELATNGGTRLNQARQTAIEHLYQSLGSLHKKNGQGFSLKNVMTQEEITGFNRSQ